MPGFPARYGLLLLACASAAAADPLPERPKLLAETLLPARSESLGWRETDDTASASIWHSYLVSRGLATKQGRGGNWCHYEHALRVLNHIRAELGAETPYQDAWAKNQIRVFGPCEGQPEADTPPSLAAPAAWPARAQGDYLYQLGSWHFYRRQYEDALSHYQQAERLESYPLRPYASYMTLRSLGQLERAGEAYARIDGLLAAPSRGPADALIANFRFILMERTSPYRIELEPELALTHLRWLLEKLKSAPEQAADILQALRDRNDAQAQLDDYFKPFDTDRGSVDWWLRDEKPGTVRLEAVQAEAKSNELVDWLQARRALNLLDQDWLWARHLKGKDYWTENAVIVRHAWQRWQTTKHGEWLLIAASRVHPDDELATVALEAASAQFARPAKGETQEYREWLYGLWRHAIRLSLGRDDVPRAAALIAEHADFLELTAQRYYGADTPVPHFEQALRWLAYQGRGEDARRILAAVRGVTKQPYAYWRTLLASTWDEATEPAKNQPGYFLADRIVGLWEAMLQLASTEALHRLAGEPTLAEHYRGALSRVVLTRAILLDQGAEAITRYAGEAARFNPEARELILSQTERRERDDHLGLLLCLPRLRPLPYLEHVEVYRQEGLRLDAMDTFHHNDNNGWCRFERAEQEDYVFAAAEIQPEADEEASDYFGGDEIVEDDEYAPYRDKQKAWLAQHPFRSQVDEQELERLGRIPSAPHYLSEFVNARERQSAAADAGERNRRAADLHRAIRTTRYGCQRNGSHARYSMETYKFLQRRYPETAWAKATPYWFGCSHFRYGCPAEPAAETTGTEQETDAAATP